MGSKRFIQIKNALYETYTVLAGSGSYGTGGLVRVVVRGWG